jgi:hypothetical protein
MKQAHVGIGWAPLVLAAALCACGGGGGSAPRLLEMGTDVAVVDIDGDGRMDVLMLTYLFGDRTPQGQLRVLRQTAPGAFAAPETYVLGCYPWSMTVADIDGDTRPDLVITDVGAWNCEAPLPGKALYLVRQDPARAGRFLPAQPLISGTQSDQVAVGDFNGDGAPDLAAGGLPSDRNQLLLLLQDPAARGSFRPATLLALGRSVSRVVAGDIDGDGRSDLFFAAYGETTGTTSHSELAISLQQADGRLGPVLPLASQSGVRAQRLAVTDLNGDGLLDLVAHFTPLSTDDRPFARALLQGAAPGGTALTWAAPADTALDGIEGVTATAFGDIDQDGLPDGVLAGSWPGSAPPLSPPSIHSRVNPLFGVGNGRFVHRGGQDVAPQPDAVAIADLDGDGRHDIVLHAGSTLWWMRQVPGTPGVFGTPQPLP